MFVVGEECRFKPGDEKHPLVQRLPHYHLVPKTTRENIEWRKNIRGEAAVDLKLRQQVWDACAEDFLFWVNGFCWIVEPREGEDQSGLIPFLTWEHQDCVFAALDFYFGKRHIIGDKSRAQGASWGEVANIVHKFIFRESPTFLGMGSKDKETADAANNPGSLGWKVDFLIEKLPNWMRPPDVSPGGKNRSLSDSTWQNVTTGSFIKAYSATSGIGRAGRFTSFFLDESAFFLAGKDTEAVSNLLKTTNNLVMLSTPNGMNNEHYERVHNPSPWLMVVLDWRDNPSQRRGKYTTQNGKLKKIDEEYDWPADYKHILDGRVRSPWYDQRCADDNHNMLFVGQELDREYSGSKGRPFPPVALEKARNFCLPPKQTGMLLYVQNEPHYTKGQSWIVGEGYKFDVWVDLDRKGNWPASRYTIGCDIASGTAGDTSSNSCLQIFDTVTRTQAGEFAANNLPPTEFAQFAVAVCYWIGQGSPSVYLNWEKNGDPGTHFTTEIQRLNYPNVYFQKQGDPLRPYAKPTDRPGYHSSRVEITIRPLVNALFTSSITVRSEALLDECGKYAYNSSGNPYFPRSVTSRDNSARGQSHGDRTIAAAIALHAMDDRPANKPKAEDILQGKKPEKYSIAWRLNEYQKKLKESSLASNRW